jgi:uncharacterized protein
MAWALITGASEGLGREFADIAAADGYDLIVSARSADKLEAVAAEARLRHKVQVVVIPADLSRAGEAERLWDAACEGRAMTVLVNNAGLGRNGDFSDPEGWAREEASLQVNLLSLTLLMKRAVVDMVRMGEGRILNVGSTAGFVPGPNMAVYHATKAYVLSLTEAVADELRASRVTVTVLCPGATQTSFFKADDAEGQTWLTKMPLPTARSVAQAGWTAMKAGKRIMVPGVQNKISAFLPRFTPRWLTTRITGALLARH